jgi:excinuclease UvrABC ATPase subunit
VLAVVTGVAGSGKSSLIYGSIVGGSVSGRDGVVSVDQTPIRGSRRSNPATYTGLLDPIRSAFAKANGVKPALFSVLNIAEVLDLSVEDAVRFFAERTPAAHAILQRIADVGLGYLRLGQPLTTLSGGERQRLKLATHIGEEGGVYVLDELTTGLHLADLEQLLGLLDRMVDSGKSVIVIEHHQAVMAHADWIIDLGPGAGHDGGRIVFEGTPADLVAARSTLTGEHLAAFVGSRPKAVRSR